MQLLPFSHLPPHAPRRFVPATADLGDWSQLEPLFDQLETRAGQCQDAADLERWLVDLGELDAAIEEEGSRRYIAMTCHTDNLEAEQAHLHFVESIEPRLKPRQFRLQRLYLAHPLRGHLPHPRYTVFDRNTQVHVELFRDENVPLETEEAKLGQQYQKLSGSLTVNFRGEERTLSQMSPLLEEPDRALRQEAWELVTARRLQEAANFEALFERLRSLREQIAANAGFSNYRDFAFRWLARFDYSPEDCQAFHQTVEDEIMPLVRDLQAERRRQMSLPALRPWDLAVDPLNRPPLRPFEQVDHLVAQTQQIFDRLDPELASQFASMRRLGLLDLANRKGKGPGGYQANLTEARLPFIFMNAVGVQRDVETLLHEAGHAFHTFATRDEPFHPYRTAPIEFCEVASMSMELLGGDGVEAFYGAADAQRARRTHLEGIPTMFAWIATVDAFQHWIYTHPRHAPFERTAAWLQLMDRFGGEVDWSGFEGARASLWHRQLHVFLHPFYYIEYGIAQLGALQVWHAVRSDGSKALRRYREALGLGSSRTLPELFAAAGARFDFRRETVKPLMDSLRQELERLG